MSSELVKNYMKNMEQLRAERKTMEMMLSATYDTAMDAYHSQRRCDETGQLRTVWYAQDGSVIPDDEMKKLVNKRISSIG